MINKPKLSTMVSVFMAILVYQNRKHQTPNPREAQAPSFKNALTKRLIWVSGLGISFRVGYWDLEFHHCGTTRYFASLGMPLVKTVASAGPGTKPLAGSELKLVSDQPRSRSTRT